MIARHHPQLGFDRPIQLAAELQRLISTPADIAQQDQIIQRHLCANLGNPPAKIKAAVSVDMQIRKKSYTQTYPPKS